MTQYNPENWVVLELKTKDETIYKVMGGWTGSYANADRWKVNSGIKSANINGDYIEFTGYSGSIYSCYIGGGCYSMTDLMNSIYSSFQTKLEGSENSIRILSLQEVLDFDFNKAQDDS